MGIQGLLRGLQGALPSFRTNVCQFSQKTLAIDASSWLHKGGYACAETLVESIESSGTTDPNSERVFSRYMLNRCEELLQNANLKGIILVFDGLRCPLKEGTNLDREERRLKNLEEARKLKREGRHKEASERYRSCVRVIESMGHTVARAVQDHFGSGEGAKVRCLFSPFEADAQLAQLCLEGVVDAIVTEDSDVLLYSAACGCPFPVIYKLERDTGACDVISMSWLINGSEELLSQAKGSLAGILRFFSFQEKRLKGSGRRMFIQGCVLAGCDYAQSRLTGVGLVNAFRMVKEQALKKAGERFKYVLRTYRNEKMPIGVDFEDYEEILSKSEAVFYYHFVWRVKDRDVASLVSPQENDQFSPKMDRFHNSFDFVGSPGCFTQKVDDGTEIIEGKSSCISSHASTIRKWKTSEESAKKHIISKYFPKKETFNNLRMGQIEEGDVFRKIVQSVKQSSEDDGRSSVKKSRLPSDFKSNPFSVFANIRENDKYFSPDDNLQTPLNDKREFCSSQTTSIPEEVGNIRRVTLDSDDAPLVSPSPEVCENSNSGDETRSYSILGAFDNSLSSVESNEVSMASGDTCRSGENTGRLFDRISSVTCKTQFASITSISCEETGANIKSAEVDMNHLKEIKGASLKRKLFMNCHQPETASTTDETIEGEKDDNSAILRSSSKESLSASTDSLNFKTESQQLEHSVIGKMDRALPKDGNIAECVKESKTDTTELIDWSDSDSDCVIIEPEHFSKFSTTNTHGASRRFQPKKSSHFASPFQHSNVLRSRLPKERKKKKRNSTDMAGFAKQQMRSASSATQEKGYLKKTKISMTKSSVSTFKINSYFQPMANRKNCSQF